MTVVLNALYITFAGVINFVTHFKVTKLHSNRSQCHELNQTGVGGKQCQLHGAGRGT